ncbi:hypothetical protein C8R43DRAFT_1121160 [Mycena crocata]|nr:hypothetical protein C8R43DRAFT_1121160 [Mycena crocata]
MSLYYSASRCSDLQVGEHFENMDYELSTLLSEKILFYDNCYQLYCSSAALELASATLDDQTHIYNDIPDLVDAAGNIIPSHYHRPKQRSKPFAKL